MTQSAYSQPFRHIQYNRTPSLRAMATLAMLEDANIKLASVATDVLGASGRSMLQAIAAGVDEPEKLAQMAR
ncbi:MAG: hypothetical protein WBW54_13795, partial [Candidatus Acidiferrales bacterium]